MDWENRVEKAMEQAAKDYSRQLRWHKAHLRTVSAKLTKPEYELFRTMCTANGTTPYRVLCRMARAYINSAAGALQQPRPLRQPPWPANPPRHASL